MEAKKITGSTMPERPGRAERREIVSNLRMCGKPTQCIKMQTNNNLDNLVQAFQIVQFIN